MSILKKSSSPALSVSRAKAAAFSRELGGAVFSSTTEAVVARARGSSVFARRLEGKEKATAVVVIINSNNAEGGRAPAV